MQEYESIATVGNKCGILMVYDRHRQKQMWDSGGVRACVAWSGEKPEGELSEEYLPKRGHDYPKADLPTLSRRQPPFVRRRNCSFYKEMSVGATKVTRHSCPSRVVPTKATARALTHPAPPNRAGNQEPQNSDAPLVIKETIINCDKNLEWTRNVCRTSLSECVKY